MSKKSTAMQFLEDLTGGPLTFGRFVQSIRLGEEMSLEAFASQLGVSRTNLSDIEHGRRGVSVERAAHWAELLGYDQAQFVRLALQAQLDEAGLPLLAQVTRAPSSKTRGPGPRKRAGQRPGAPSPEATKRRGQLIAGLLSTSASAGD
jgi:transcriptional regulator with XRE-family HTH domain